MCQLIRTFRIPRSKVTVLCATLAALVTIALFIPPWTTIESIDSFLSAEGWGNVLALPVFVSICAFFVLCVSGIKKRTFCYSAIGGALFGFCQTLGGMTAHNEHLFNGSPINLFSVSWFLFCVFAHGSLFTFLIAFLFTLADNRGHNDRLKSNKANKAILYVTGSSRGAFFIRVSLLLLIWLVYYLFNFPGSVSPDIASQVRQALGFIDINNHHPVLHTLFFGLFYNIGLNIFGSLPAGLAIGCAFQMIIFGCTLSFMVSYMGRIGISYRWRVVTLLFFILYPIVAYYSFTLWKDITLGLFVLLFVLSLTKILTLGRQFFSSPFRVIGFVLILLGLCFSKNTGVYIVFLSILPVVLFIKGSRVQISFILITVMLSYQLITGPLYTALGYAQAGSQELLSLPILQVSNIVRLDPGSISEEDKELVAAVLPYDQISERYNTKVSDSLKGKLNVKVVMESPVKYLSLWVRLGLDHPALYTETLLNKSYGYWYPDAQHWIVSDNFSEYETSVKNEYASGDMSLTSDGENPFLWQYSETYVFSEYAQNLRDITIEIPRKLPLVSLLYSIGFYFWLLLTAALYCIYKRRYEHLLLILPLFVIWLTCVVSPVFSEFRYAWPAIICVPFIIGYIFAREDDNVTYDTSESSSAL